MNRLIAVLSMCLLAVACSKPAEAPQEGSDRIFDIPYLMRDLDNGLRVIVVKTDYPDIVTIQIPVQTGSRNEVEPGKSGFAHFFEHMMFRGTEKYPADQYSSILKNAGADQNAYTTDDYTNYHITFTKDDLEKIIELEADRFQSLAYSEEQFRTEALAVKGEYLKNFSDPISKMFERISDLMFDVHTYEHTTMGFIEDIEAMPDQIEYSHEFFDRWYRPEKAVVILVGDVDPEATFNLVEKYWGGWERGDYAAEIPAEPPLEGPLYEHLQWDSPTQPWFTMTWRGPAFVPTEPDMPSMDIISSVYFSDSSDLYRKLVIEEQWVDQLFAYFPDQIDPNMLLVAARLTDASHATDVRDAINETLAEARTQLIPTDKLEQTKSRLRYAFTSRLDSSGRIGAMLARYVHMFRTPETVNEAFATYDSLTPEVVRDAANRYFVDSQRVTFTLSADESMQGVDGKASLDELVAARGMAESAPGATAEEAPAELVVAATDVEAPVEFVAKPLSSSPLVNVSFLVHAGSGFDPEGKKGLAAMTAALLTDGGSEALSIDEINEAMYPMAAGFGAQVDKEMTRLSGLVHKDNLDKWYSLVRGQLLFPAWSEQDFERIRTNMVNAIRTDLVGNNDEELGKEFLYARLYGADHPYGSFNLGNVSDLETITLVDVKRFYEEYYTIANMTVGLAGGYPDDLPARISADLQKLDVGARAMLPLPPAPLPEGRKAVVIEKQTPGVAVSFGFPIELKRGDPDWVALWLARSFIGEHRSSNSHLYKRIRETRGMNYGDYAYIEYFPRGMFQFHPDTNLGRQQQVFQVWLRPLRSNKDAHFATRTAMFELEKFIEEGMSESDFEATRAFLSKFVALLTDGQSRQLGYQMDSQYYGIDNFSDYVREGLANLTLADVNRVIRENLDLENVQYVFISKDATELSERLVNNRESPMTYEADKPRELLGEDAVISRIDLGFSDADVEIVPADEVFN